MKTINILLFVVLLLVTLTSCNVPSGATSEPAINCPEEEVSAYLANLELLLERWDDVEDRAMVSSRLALGPVVGELQDLRREAKSVDQPDCAKMLNDTTVVAMDQTIDMFLAFMEIEDDLTVSWIQEAADAAWHDIDVQVSDALQNGINPKEIGSLEILSVDRKAPVAPEEWEEEQIPTTNVSISVPPDWYRNIDDSTIEITSPDGNIQFFFGFDDETMELLSDGGPDQLMNLTEIMEDMSSDSYYHQRETKSLHWNKYDAYLVRSIHRSLATPMDTILGTVVVKDTPQFLMYAYASDTVSLPFETFATLNKILNSVRIE